MFGAAEDYLGVDPNLPGKPTSIWIDTTSQTHYLKLNEDLDVDVVIIGGGIAGLTAAYLLKESGKSVAVIESRRIVDDVTGHTTAKITSQQGLIYKYLIDNFGLEKATIYAKASESAIKLISVIVEENEIRCDFLRKPMYVFTEYPAYLKDIKDEFEAAKSVGLNVEYTEKVDFPLPIIGAIKVENQAEFHPRKYLLALAKLIDGDGSLIFENTEALDIVEGDKCVVTTNTDYKITADQVIIATNFPFYDKGSYFTKLYPIRSYVLGVKIEDELPEGMYYSIEKDNYHSFRSQMSKTGPMLIVNGYEHKAGQGGDTEEIYNNLINYAKENLKVKSIDYHWSTQDNRTPDRVPYIGLSPKSEKIYLATGFNGWGMTNGTVAAIIITEEILGKKNPWAEFFSPDRKSSVIAKAPSFISENLNVMEQYVKKAVGREDFGFVTDLPEGQGKIVEYGDKKVAAFKDENDQLHMVSPNCTHLGCQVNWNNAEKTWDCPCHGSRYKAEGDVIHGPALYPLKKEGPEAETSENKSNQ